MTTENGSKLTLDSPEDDAQLLEAGFIRRPHGVRGEMMVDLDENLLSFIKPGQEMTLGEGDRELTIISIRKHKNGYLLLFEEITSPEEVSSYRFKKLYLPNDGIEGNTPEGEYLGDQLLGLIVITDHGIELGKLTEVILTGANDVYLIKNSINEILLPAIPEVIKKIDLDNNEMHVHIIPGLISDEELNEMESNN